MIELAANIPAISEVRPGPWWMRPLHIHEFARLRNVSLTEMACACRLSRTAVHGIAYKDIWPVRASRRAIEEQLRALFAARGATPEELAMLFVPLPPEKVRFANEAKHTPLRPVAEQEGKTPMLLAKQSLRSQARKAFKLFINPFDGEVTSEAVMFTSPEIAYVREACLQAALGARFVAVVGESGSGKTTMLADLEARILRENTPVQLVRPWVLGMEDSDRLGKALKSTDILASIITTLDPLATVPQSIQARSTKAKKLLLQTAESGVFVLIVIEEAHCLPDSTLKHLKRLHEMRRGLRPLLGILLIAQPELAARLDPRRATLREVTQRCEVVHLMPLDSDLKAYLVHRVKAIERPLADFIDESGIEAIRARLTVAVPGPAGKSRAVSLVHPLVVNNLMTAALNACAEIGAPIVSADVVRAV